MLKKYLLFSILFTLNIQCSESLERNEKTKALKIVANYSNPGKIYIPERYKKYILYLIEILEYLGINKLFRNDFKKQEIVDLLLIVSKKGDEYSLEQYDIEKLKVSKSIDELIINEKNEKKFIIEVSTYEKIQKLGTKLTVISNNTFKLTSDKYLHFNNNEPIESFFIKSDQYNKNIFSDLYSICC